MTTKVRNFLHILPPSSHFLMSLRSLPSPHIFYNHTNVSSLPSLSPHSPPPLAPSPPLSPSLPHTVSSCGHAMHLACHTKVFGSMSQDARFGSSYEGNQVIDVKKGELLCPLCKGIGNTILPHTPPHIGRARLPLCVPCVGSDNDGYSGDNGDGSNGDGNNSSNDTKMIGNNEINNNNNYRKSSVIKDISTLLNTTIGSNDNNKGLFREQLNQFVMSLLPDYSKTKKDKNNIKNNIDNENKNENKNDNKNENNINDYNIQGLSLTTITKYEKIIASGFFQRSVLNNFLPLWHTDSTNPHQYWALTKPDLIRSTHLLWAATAYTLMSASRAKSWLGGERGRNWYNSGFISNYFNNQIGLIRSTGGGRSGEGNGGSRGGVGCGVLDPNIDEKEMTLLYQLLLLLRTLDPVLYHHDAEHLQQNMIQPLGELLGGKDPGKFYMLFLVLSDIFVCRRILVISSFSRFSYVDEVDFHPPSNSSLRPYFLSTLR